jgi:predicted alpha/beta-fold hydrolase
MKNIQLIQTETSDNLILNGLFKEVPNSKSIVILIHGFTTDFYTHKFFHSIQDKLEESGVSSVAIQTRGTGMHTEFLKSGREDGVNLGSFHEKLEEAHLDISAWIKTLTALGYENIYLAGHSLGTIKTVRYLYEGEYKDKIKKIILLAPFDKNAYVENKTEGEWKRSHIQIAKEMIDNGKEEEVIPDTFDDFPMTYQT